ncbi:MAG: hypothetical protein KGL39_12510 [Patescibacteria group bacterium]|nr:hypothetical protein [Patescibacteria group bacterium]
MSRPGASNHKGLTMQATTGTKTAIWISLIGAVLSAIQPQFTLTALTTLLGSDWAPLVNQVLPWAFAWLTHGLTGNSATPMVPGVPGTVVNVGTGGPPISSGA